MFAGKTTELIRRLEVHAQAGRRVVAFRPVADTRYERAVIITHAGKRWNAVCVPDAAAIIAPARGFDAVGIDEAHFFGAALTRVCRGLIGGGATVVVAGVERNHRGEPFEPFPELLCEADEVVKFSGPCAKCGRPAVHSQRMFANDAHIVVGGVGAYEARCRACFGLP